MPLQGGLTIERMCQPAQVSRASFYRWLQEPPPMEAEMEVRSAIQQIAKWNIGGGTAIGAFLRNSDDEGCQ